MADEEVGKMKVRPPITEAMARDAGVQIVQQTRAQFPNLAIVVITWDDALDPERHAALCCDGLQSRAQLIKVLRLWADKNAREHGDIPRRKH